MAEHVHRFVQALDVWTHPWYRHWAADDLDDYCDFVREETELRLGIEADFLPGPRGPARQPARRARLGLRGRLGPLPARRGGRLPRLSGLGALGHLARRPTRRRSGRATSRRSARRRAAALFDILAHPDLVKVWGARVPRARGRPAPLLRARDGRNRGVGRGDRGVHRRACASRSARSTRRPAFLEMCLEAGPPGGAVERRPHARAARLRVRARASSCSTGSASRSSRCSTGASGGWSRSDEPGRHRLGLAPPRGRAGRWCSAAWRSRTRRAGWSAGPTPTCSRTR